MGRDKQAIISWPSSAVSCPSFSWRELYDKDERALGGTKNNGQLTTAN
jgi:hypothetical protein